MSGNRTTILFVFVHRFGDLQRGPHRGARRAADQDAFFAGDAAGRREGVAVGDHHPLVHHVAVEGAGQKSSPMPSTL